MPSHSKVALSGASIAAEKILLVSQKSGAAVLIAALVRLSQMTGVASCGRLPGNIRRRRQISSLLFWRLSKAYAGSATVLLDELKARELQDGTSSAAHWL